MALLTMYPGKEFTPFTTLAQGINETETRIRLTGLTDEGGHIVFPDAPNRASIFLPGTGTGEVVQYVLVGSDANGPFIDVVRAEGGAAQAWPAGARIGRYFTAQDLWELQQNMGRFYAEKDANGGIATLDEDGKVGQIALAADALTLGAVVSVPVLLSGTTGTLQYRTIGRKVIVQGNITPSAATSGITDLGSVPAPTWQQSLIALTGASRQFDQQVLLTITAAGKLQAYSNLVAGARLFFEYEYLAD